MNLSRLLMHVCLLCLIRHAALGMAPPAVFAGELSGRSAARSVTDGSDPAAASHDEIAALIEGLASNSYATRIRCRDRLMRIGLAAFDQLRQARNHPDNEVAIVARRLTSGLRVQWATANDSTQVRDLLSEYGSHSVSERRKRIQSIGKLPRAEAFSPLLRLSRFEAEPSLAREAAIAFLRLDDRDGAPNPQEAAQIESMLAPQSRIGSDWLKQYAADLRDGELHMDAWAGLIQSHRERLIADGAGSDSESEVSTHDLLELIWATAERAIRQGRDAAATELVVANVDLIPSRTRELMETANWALEHSFYPAVIAMHDGHRMLYRKSPILLYSAAEAYSRMERNREANELADLALEINPLPKPEPDLPDSELSETEAEKEEARKLAQPLDVMHPQTIENNAVAHNEIAAQLISRGLFRWAEKEYRLVIDRLPVDNTLSSFARLELATLLGEQLKHAEAVETLAPLTDRIDRDDEFRDRLIVRRFPYPTVQSEMDFQRGLLMIQQGDVESAKPILRSAFEMNKANIDILIAMYRLEGDEEWKASVKNTLDEQIAEAHRHVEDERNANLPGGQWRPSDRRLASALNAYAWLVCNTEGDMQQALRYSKESLQIIPSSYEMMDTCARCYFAVGDYEQAVAMQLAACEGMPHSPPLLRQLDEFREALKKSRAGNE